MGATFAHGRDRAPSWTENHEPSRLGSQAGDLSAEIRIPGLVNDSYPMTIQASASRAFDR